MFFVSLSTVMASDANDANIHKNGNLTVLSGTDDVALDESDLDISNDEQSSESGQGNVLSASSGENTLGADDGSIGSLKIKIETSGDVELENNYYFTSVSSIQRITVRDKVIDGKGYTIKFDSSSTTSSYNIVFYNPSNVIFKNINFVFRNSYFFYTNPSSLTFINCTFAQSHAGESFAFYTGANSNIINCTFYPRTLVQPNLMIETKIINTTFEDMRNTLNINNANIEVINSTFKASTSAIMSISSASAKIMGCTFESIGGTAGAISKLPGTFNIYNCTFKSFKSRVIATFVSHQILNVYNCTFINNSAPEQGSVFYVTNTNSVLNVYGSSFIGNSISTYDATKGGGVIFSSTSGTLSITSSYFKGNSANSEGGCIRHSGLLTIQDTIFESNSAVDGGGIMAGNDKSSIATIINCTFINNIASRWGGALQQRKATIDGCKFINNSANPTNGTSGQFDPHGGAIYGRDYMIIKNSEFYGNKARTGGAICFEYRITSVSSIEGCIFENNSAVSRGGGAIYSDAAADVKISSSYFTNNTAPEGGAIYLDSYKGKGSVFISSSHFTANTATSGSGGSIYHKGFSLTVSDNSFFFFI